MSTWRFFVCVRGSPSDPENPVPAASAAGKGQVGNACSLSTLIDTCHFAWPNLEGRLGDLSGLLAARPHCGRAGISDRPHLRCRMTSKLLNAWGSLPTPVSWGRGQESTSLLSEEDLRASHAALKRILQNAHALYLSHRVLLSAPDMGENIVTRKQGTTELGSNTAAPTHRHATRRLK